MRSFLVLLVFQCLSCAAAEDKFQLFPLQIGAMVGYIDEAGHLVIKPKFLFGGQFSEGYAAVQDRSLVLGFLDRDGRFFQVKGAKRLKNFRGSRAVVQFENGLFGYLDKNLRVAIEPKFSSASDFSDGLACVEIPSTHKTSQFTFIDSTGAEAFKTRYDWASTFSGGLAVIKRDGKYGLIDTGGIEIVNPTFSSVHLPLDGLIAFSIRKDQVEKWGFLDRLGNVAIEPQFADVNSSFREGFAAVKVGKNWGLIDVKGAFVIEPQFEELTAPSKSIIRFKKNQRWGYMYTDGRLLHEAEFDGALEFIDGLASVSKFSVKAGVNQDLDGYLKTDGTVIWGSDFAEGNLQ